MSEAAKQIDPQADLKRQAAEYAVRYVESGMAIGLGTGSTAIFAVRYIGELLRKGALKNVVAFATSTVTAHEAIRLMIPLLPEDLPRSLDVTIDGADEVDPQLNLIKGGGGALLREKLVAQNTTREIIVVDDSKMSPRLGTRHVLPIEVLPFGWRSSLRYLETLGATCVVRSDSSGKEYHTDQGNIILDCNFGPIADVAQLASQLDRRAGIVEHGLFIGLTQLLVVGGPNGVRETSPT